MTTEDKFTIVERRVADLRTDGEVDQADVEALLNSEDSVDKRAGLRGLVLTATGDYGCFKDDLPSLTPLLTDPDPNVRYNAIHAVVALLPSRDVPLKDANAIASLLNDDSDRVAEKALDTLPAVAKRDPDTVKEEASDIVRFLNADRSEIRKRAIRFFLILVQEYPADAAIAADRFAELVGETYEMPEFDGDEWTTPLAHEQTRQDLVAHVHEERERHMTIREFAAEILIILLQERPDVVRSNAEVLGEHLSHDEPHVRRQALRVFTALGNDWPEVVVEAADEIVACIDNDQPDELVKAAVKPTGIVTSEQPDQVVPDLLDRVDVLASLLNADDPHVRGTAVGLLSHVAECDTTAVEPIEDEIVDLLSDDQDFVRGNAVWALQSLRTDKSVSVLNDRLAEEPDEEVRRSIGHALNTLESAKDIET